MDFKDLLKLAKDNQSYIQKKHEREKQAKGKNGESKPAQFSEKQKQLLLRKEKELQLKKEARRLELQRKVIEKQQALLECEAAENKKKYEKLHGGASTAGHSTKSKAAHPTQGRSSSNRDVTMKSGKGVHQQSKTKQKPSSGVIRTSNKNDRATTAGLKVANLHSKKSIYQGKSGTAKGSNMSFKELMKLAKEQQNKPTSSSDSLPLSAKAPQRKEMDKQSMRSSAATDISKTKQPTNGKRVSTSAGSTRPTSEMTASKARSVNTAAVGASGAHTAAAQTGYMMKSKREVKLSPQRRETHNNPSLQKRKLQELDNELELKRRDIERQKRLLQNKYRRGYEEEEEWIEDYDESDLDGDLDDFIDDSDSNVNVSKYIQQIFGYKKSKYADEDDDLRDMESNYKQIQQEEARSSRIGKMEDEIERIREQKMLAKEQRMSTAKKR